MEFAPGSILLEPRRDFGLRVIVTHVLVGLVNVRRLRHTSRCEVGINGLSTSRDPHVATAKCTKIPKEDNAGLNFPSGRHHGSRQLEKMPGFLW